LVLILGIRDKHLLKLELKNVIDGRVGRVRLHHNLRNLQRRELRFGQTSATQAVRSSESFLRRVEQLCWLGPRVSLGPILNNETLESMKVFIVHRNFL
jgi:hypothetical protein